MAWVFNPFTGKLDQAGSGGGSGSQVNSDWNSTSGVSQILNKPSLFSGAYADLTGKPTLFSGAYSALTGTPSTFAPSAHASSHASGGSDALTLASSQITGLASVATSGAYSSLTGTPSLATVATSGSAADLSTGTLASARLPSIPDGNLSSNVALLTGTQSFTGAKSFDSGTLTTSQPLSITQTWNASGVTMKAATINVTDTASAAASLLLDLQVGGVTKASITKTGAYNIAGVGLPSSGIGWTNSNHLALAHNGLTRFMVNSLGITANGSDTNLGFNFASANESGTSFHSRILTDGAGTVAIRNGTAAQTFRLYNTYTDASNYERGFMDWTTNANTLTIGTTGAGTGTANRSIALRIGTQTGVNFSANGTGIDMSGTRSYITGGAMSFGPGTSISGWTNTNYASGAADPTTSTLTSGNWQVYRNTTTGVVKLWANNAGTLVSVALA